jgi:putative CocE/NonD family hydrolase
VTMARSRRWLAVFYLVAVADAFGASLMAQTNVMIPMRDGTHLATDLYFPEQLNSELPTLMVRTAYGKHDAFKGDPFLAEMVANGYVIAVQDIRGRYASEGRYKPGQHNRDDGYDTVEWLTSRDWSNQRLGSVGCSYLGEVQLVLAATRHPNHVAAFPMAPATGFYAPGRAWMSFDGGVFELAQTAGWFYYYGSQIMYGPPAWVDRKTWFDSPAAGLFRQTPEPDSENYAAMLGHLPVVDALRTGGAPPSDYENFAGNAPDAEYFRNMEFATADDRFNVPAVFVDSWYDYGVAETLKVFDLFSKNADSDLARDNQFMIVAPSTHCGYWGATENTVIGSRPLGDARIDLNSIQQRWFDHWLKDGAENFEGMPRIQYYLMGKNEWRSAEAWPIPGTRNTEFFLHSDGRANSRTGDGSLRLVESNTASSDAYTYDPATPVPTLGGQTCCSGLPEGEGAYDQSTNEMRHDILVYSSAPLEQGLEVTGNLEVVLYVSSSAADTDFTAKLVDVYPDGRAFNVQEGALRMRYRQGLDKNLRMRPGEVYEISLDLHATGNYFGPGHRIRLDVSSSNFPRWDRNLNTGGNNYDESAWRTADNRVHHGPKYPSRLILPVVH